MAKPIWPGVTTTNPELRFNNFEPQGQYEHGFTGHGSYIANIKGSQERVLYSYGLDNARLVHRFYIRYKNGSVTDMDLGGKTGQAIHIYEAKLPTGKRWLIIDILHSGITTPKRTVSEIRLWEDNGNIISIKPTKERA
jgi:hypothetical protein